MLKLEWGGESLQLLPERAVFWPARGTLLLADSHFGKPATFRRAGIPVPHESHDSDLARLARALAATRAARLLILGDFFHARSGVDPHTLEALSTWRSANPEIEVTLVRGNHDHHAGDPPGEWGFRCHSGALREGPFTFTHQACEAGDSLCFAGHVHPCAILQDTNGARVRLPCFHFATRVALLPAFGGFTGMKRVRPRPEDRVFVVCPDEVVEASGRREERDKTRAAVPCARPPQDC